jgi:hypothetical protein
MNTSSKMTNDVEKAAADALYHYGCVMTARGLNRDELTILMRARNAGMDTPLDEGKVDEIAQSAFLFAMKNDTNIDLPTITATQRQLVPLLNEIYESLRPDITLYRHGGGLVSLMDGKRSHYTAESMPKLLSARANYVSGKNNESMFPPAVAAKVVLYSIDDKDKIRPLKRVTNVPVLRPDGTVFDSPGYDAATGIYYHPVGDIVKIPRDPTQQYAAKAVLHSIDDKNKIRPLKRITNVPVLRSDGTVFDSPGYDTATGIYYHPTGDVPKIQPNPTRENAVDAAAWLLDLLHDFPYE